MVAGLDIAVSPKFTFMALEIWKRLPIEEGNARGSTLEDVQIDPATQHNNTSNRRLYEITAIAPICAA